MHDRPMFHVHKPNHPHELVCLLSPDPPDVILSYLLLAARELHALGKLPPHSIRRLAALLEQISRLDQAA